MSPAQFFFHTELGHFMLYCAGIAFVGGMPAPTATSGTAYKWAFSSLNMFAMNFNRARGPKVESSPNFLPAVDIHIAKANGNSTPNS